MDDQQLRTPPVPPKVADVVDAPELAEAWDHQVAARRAEAGKITAILEYKSRLVAEYQQVPQAPVNEVQRAAVRDAALLLGVSEMTTLIMLDAATVARDFLPVTWAAFQQGRIDMLRVRKITTATEDLDEALLAEVDARVVEEAACRGLADFHQWLHRYIAQVDVEAHQAVCARRRGDRFVRFTHRGDGTSYLHARLPTLEAAAIEKRLRISAHRHHTRPGQDDPTRQAENTDHPDHLGHPEDPALTEHLGQAENTGPVEHPGPDASAPASGAVAPDDTSLAEHTGQAGGPGQAEHSDQTGGASRVDDRTLDQRQADLLSAWLRTGDTPEEGAAAVEAKIMIMIPETTLTGETNEPAMAADRSWMLAADRARALASDSDAVHDWYQGRVRPDPGEADVDVLSATYVGRYPPARLREALIFRDGTCQATGCTIAAERCDLDHQIPWQAGGDTSAGNLWALCRRHHRLKSHGFLTPPTRPPTAAAPSPPKAPGPPTATAQMESAPMGCSKHPPDD